jgi:hypothetical protein
MMNVTGSDVGAIVKRNGLQTFATPSSALTSLVASEATPTNALVASAGTTLVSVDTGGAVSTIGTGFTSGARWEGLLAPAVGGQGPMYLINGVDPPQQWSGATASTATALWQKGAGTTVDIPNGKYSTQANNQMYIAGVPAFPNRVYVSAQRDPTNWDPAVTSGPAGTGLATSFDLDPTDGQVITAIGRAGPYVVVFKPRKTYVIIAPGSIVSGDNLNVRMLSDSIGCVANRSLASGSLGTYFLSEGRGVYVTNGSTLKPISDKVLPLLQIAAPQAANAAGFYFSGHYYLSIASTGSGVNNLTLDYDEILGSWWKHSFGSNELVAWHPAGVAQLFSAKSTAPILDRCFAPNVHQDNGQGFTWVWKGPWQSPSFYRRRMFPSTWYRKRLRQIRLEGFGTVDYYLAKDFITTETLIRQNVFPGTLAGAQNFGGPGTFAGPGLFGGGAPIGQADIFSLGVARAFSQVFSATSNTQDEVYGYTLALTDRVDRWD